MPKISFLPFNAAEPARPALGRQLSNFLYEAMKSQPGVEANFANFLAQVGTPEDPRAAFVNLGDQLAEPEFIRNLLQQSDAEFAVDGLITREDGNYHLTLRVTPANPAQEPVVAEKQFQPLALFDTLKWMIQQTSTPLAIQMQPGFIENLEFGTDDPEAFEDFLIGYDAISYIQSSQGRVAEEFNVGDAFDNLLDAVRKDPDFIGPYEATIQLAQLCARAGVGTFPLVEEKLKQLAELVPEDWRATYALGDLYFTGNRFDLAMDAFDKAIQIHEKARQESPDEQPEPALYSRLGMAQQQLGMVANAERSYKRAIEQEGPDKPSMDLLTALLASHGRGHEVPGLWRSILDNDTHNPQAWAKYAIALIQTGDDERGRAAFEEGLEKTDQSPIVKRWFAPYLTTKEEYDKAMDLYEDVLEFAPKDVQVLIEYAQTLDKAGRKHEVPDVLKQILASEPDQNTKANTQAWLYEIEQPKRAELVEQAQAKIEKEDFNGAIADLEPLTEWMSDYWKPWGLLATLYNRVQRYTDAEKACMQLLQLFPAFEPGYVELAEALAGQGRAEEAYRILMTVLSQNPRSAMIALALAKMAKTTGRAEEARAITRQLREVMPKGDPEIEKVLSELES